MTFFLSSEGEMVDSKEVRIVDLGRGPQIEGHRLTVLDVFYYLHRGYDYEFIHRAMPSLTREQFDAVAQYGRQHIDELVEQDRRVEEFHRQGMEAQHSQGGIFAKGDDNQTTETRAMRLREKLKSKEAGKNGARHPH